MKKFLKQFYWVILGIFLLGVVFSAPALKQWNNSKFELSQYRMLFTDTGLPNGTPVIDINSWWSNISYWPLLDWELNPYITWYSETDPVFLTNSGNYYPLAWNSISNPITGALYMENGSGAFNLEILTWQNVGLPMTADVPVLTPTAFLPGAGIFKVMLTKGRQFFMGEPGENTQMYLVNSTGDIGWRLDSNDNSARFKLQPFTGWAMNGLMWYTQWNVDWTIQAGNTGIITAINAGTPETYVTKGYVDTVTDEYIPRTAVDTGFNNTGSDVIIPSEKAVWSLVSWLNNNYIPYRSGDKLYDTKATWNWNSIVYEWANNYNALLFLSNTGTNSVGLTSRGYGVGIYWVVHTLSPGGYGVYWKTYNPNSVAVFADSTYSWGIALKAQSQTYTGTAIETVWAIVLTGNTVSRRLVLSWDNLSIQALTGWVWVEKESFTND